MEAGSTVYLELSEVFHGPGYTTDRNLSMFVTRSREPSALPTGV